MSPITKVLMTFSATLLLASCGGGGGGGAPSVQLAVSTPFAYTSGPLIANDAGNCSNQPPSRNSAATWTDLSGNFWMFGGGGQASGNPVDLNDLWMFSPGTKTWTFIGGQCPSTGTQPNGTTPGGRSGAGTWVDRISGHLWMFGGTYVSGGSTSYLNDLWEYTISNNSWTLVTPANAPPAIRAFAITWTDSSGNLWLFGGLGDYTSSHLGYLNDVWKYSISGNSWTGPSSTSANQSPAYPPSTPNPGGRAHAASWLDASGNLWLYGGMGGVYGISTNIYADVWELPSSGYNAWQFIGGSQTSGAPPSFGPQNVAGPSYTPGALQSAVTWTTTSSGTSHFWLFGGIDASPTNNTFNNLWEYTPGNGWAWIGGQQNTADVSNLNTSLLTETGSRAGAMGWVSVSGSVTTLWLFGGAGYGSGGGIGGNLNDLWAYAP